MLQFRLICLYILVFVLQGFLFDPLPARADGFVVVINNNNTVDTMSSRSIRQIFLYRQTHWPDGSAINIVLNDTSVLYKDFTWSMLGKSPNQYLIFRKKLLFNGTAIPPRSVRSDEDVIRYVERHKNGIGFIAATSSDSRVKEVDILEMANP